MTPKTRCWLKQQKLSVFLGISASSWRQDQPGKLNVFWHVFWESWICLELLSLPCKAEALESRYEHKHNESGTQVQTGLRSNSRRLNVEQLSPYFTNFFCSWGWITLYPLKERFMTLLRCSFQMQVYFLERQDKEGKKNSISKVKSLSSTNVKRVVWGTQMISWLKKQHSQNTGEAV